MKQIETGVPDMRVAAIQLTSTADQARNLETAERLLAGAAGEGARLIVLPEMFNVLGEADVLRAGAEPLDGPSLRWASAQARRHGVWLVAGSIMERVEGQERIFNTSCLFDPAGERRAIYRKIHLFDCDVPGASYHESATVLPGRDIVRTEAGGVPLGLSICFDLRSRWPRRSRNARDAITGKCWCGRGPSKTRCF
jgi:predicted amidohydrolase